MNLFRQFNNLEKKNGYLVTKVSALLAGIFIFLGVVSRNSHSNDSFLENTQGKTILNKIDNVNLSSDSLFFSKLNGIEKVFVENKSIDTSSMPLSFKGLIYYRARISKYVELKFLDHGKSIKLAVKDKDFADFTEGKTYKIGIGKLIYTNDNFNKKPSSDTAYYIDGINELNEKGISTSKNPDPTEQRIEIGSITPVTNNNSVKKSK